MYWCSARLVVRLAIATTSGYALLDHIKELSFLDIFVLSISMSDHLEMGSNAASLHVRLRFCEMASCARKRLHLARSGTTTGWFRYRRHGCPRSHLAPARSASFGPGVEVLNLPVSAGKYKMGHSNFGTLFEEGEQ
jgi:hypothetical protein